MPTKTGPKETVAAFGVVKRGGLYFPIRFTIEDGKVVNESQCGPAGPYRQIAYQYAEGSIMDWLSSAGLKEAHEQVKKP